VDSNRAVLQNSPSRTPLRAPHELASADTDFVARWNREAIERRLLWHAGIDGLPFRTDPQCAERFTKYVGHKAV
jgi:hypothetical protein